ncbi:hypothetical protein [Cohnella nanjingensis]|uniref:Coil containing protein n=1 Tax=Cohnella nanjingensis TaxID=1387779 RepID=A0A7X0RSD2_9BACL|nr:hypothetical protein [Cohnella nanjingensis]MBB6672613.1 hypothetical protein [Cohnella nanjingensis]
MERLQTQIAELENDIKKLQDDASNAVDADQALEIKGEIAAHEEDLRLKRDELEKIQKAEEVAQVIAASTDTFKVGDTVFTLEQLTADENSAKIIRKGLEALGEQLTVKSVKWLSDITALRTEYESKLAEKDAVIDVLNKNAEDLQDTNAKQHMDLEQVSAERDHLAQRVREQDTIIQQKNGELDDLRVQLAQGAVNAVKVINIDSTDDVEAAARAVKARIDADNRRKEAERQAAKRRIYNVQEINNVKSTAQYADTDEWFEFNPLYIAQYVVLNEDELARFREENSAKNIETETDVAGPVDVVAPSVEAPPLATEGQFQGESGDGSPVGEGQPSEGGTVAEVTREEFDALKKQVSEIASQVFGNQSAA